MKKRKNFKVFFNYQSLIPMIMITSSVIQTYRHTQNAINKDLVFIIILLDILVILVSVLTIRKLNEYNKIKELGEKSTLKSRGLTRKQINEKLLSLIMIFSLKCIILNI